MWFAMTAMTIPGKCCIPVRLARSKRRPQISALPLYLEIVMDWFRVKVKRNVVTYLWGGPGISATLPQQRQLTVPLLLNIRVDDLGEEIEFGYHESGNQQIGTFGKLKP